MFTASDNAEQHSDAAITQRHLAHDSFEHATSAQSRGRPQSEITIYARAARLHGRAADLHDQAAAYLRRDQPAQPSA
jgi:hypothetical protein